MAPNAPPKKWPQSPHDDGDVSLSVVSLVKPQGPDLCSVPSWWSRAEQTQEIPCIASPFFLKLRSEFCSVDTAALRNGLMWLWRLRHPRSVISILEAQKDSCLVPVRVWFPLPFRESCPVWRWPDFLNHSGRSSNQTLSLPSLSQVLPGGLTLFRKGVWVLRLFGGAWWEVWGLIVPPS